MNSPPPVVGLVPASLLFRGQVGDTQVRVEHRGNLATLLVASADFTLNLRLPRSDCEMLARAFARAAGAIERYTTNQTIGDLK